MLNTRNEYYYIRPMGLICLPYIEGNKLECYEEFPEPKMIPEINNSAYGWVRFERPLTEDEKDQFGLYEIEED